MNESLDILVLAGGPDRERVVSLKSGAQVAGALREAGHRVVEADAGPKDVSAIHAFHDRFPDGVVFPVMHGAWGEGGALQHALAAAGVAFVGCREAAARLCMNKLATNRALRAAGVETIACEQVTSAALPAQIQPPLVMKAACEGSSFGLHICHDEDAVRKAHQELTTTYDTVMAEQFIAGPEVTVGVLQVDPSQPPVALPLIRIVPATEYYDFDAKYERDDTQYLFGEATGLSRGVIERAQAMAVRVFASLGCRHLARVDLMVDGEQPRVMEVNTMPGFTDHSLLPMAARASGMTFAQLVDQLVRAAARPHR